MLAPYRISAAPIELASAYSWQDKIKTKLRRKFLIWSKGSFKKRFPFRCEECNKRRLVVAYPHIYDWPQTYYPCGHKCNPRAVRLNDQTEGGGPG